MFTVVIIYTALRFNDPINSLPGVGNERFLDLWWITIIFSNLCIIISIFTKLHFFMKINDELGMLVELIITCLKDVIPFFIFLLIWLLAFTLLYKILGVETKFAVEYPNINPYFI